jgi:predicted ATPase
MKLEAIKFLDFLTIRGNELDIENDITCLVGINESGKSNILIGIEHCDGDKKLENRQISRQSDAYLKTGSIPSLEMTLSPSDDDERDLFQQIFGHDEIETIKLMKTGDTYRIDFPRIDYLLSDLSSEEEEDSEDSSDDEETEEAKQTPEEIQGESRTTNTEARKITKEEEKSIRENVTEIVVDYLPKFRYFDSVDFEQYYLPPDGEVQITDLIANPLKHIAIGNLLKLGEAKPSDLQNPANASERTRRDTRLAEATRKINTKLLNAFWPTKSVQLVLSAESDLLQIRVKDEKEFLPGERSRGLQWALAFNIFFLASADEELKDTVLLIDEPGVFLHINAQGEMLRSSFPKIAEKGNQIVYSTHLPYLIDKTHPERIRILEKKGEDTIIGNKAWFESDFGAIPEPVRTALGLNLEDAFLFGELNLIVEGPVDQLYFGQILNKFQPEFFKSITIVPAYGATRIPTVCLFAMLANKKSFGIVDSDKDLSKLLHDLPDIRYKKVSIENLSEIAEKHHVTSEDILPEDLFRKAVYKVYSKEFKRRNKNLKVNDLPIEYPRVQKLETYFRAELSSKNHKLLKMEIARAFLRIANEEKDGKSSSWEKAESFAESLRNKIVNEKPEE